MRDAYETYKKQFRAKTGKIKKKGLKVNVEQLSRRQFEYVRTALINERRLSGRSNPGAVTRDIINKQLYGDTSKKQAKSLQEAAKNMGIRLTQQRIRLNARRDVGTREFYEALQNRRDELRKAGMSAKEINETIGMEYFGS